MGGPPYMGAVGGRVGGTPLGHGFTASVLGASALRPGVVRVYWGLWGVRPVRGAARMSGSRGSMPLGSCLLSLGLDDIGRGGGTSRACATPTFTLYRTGYSLILAVRRLSRRVRSHLQI